MKAPRSRKRSEQHLQTKIVGRLEREFDCFVCHCPNGSYRTKVEAVALKAMGVKAGHPDLIVYGREGRLVLLEVKVPGGALSPAQRRVIPDLQARGFPVFTVDTVDEAAEALREVGFGPRQPAALSTLDTGGF